MARQLHGISAASALAPAGAAAPSDHGTLVVLIAGLVAMVLAAAWLEHGIFIARRMAGSTTVTLLTAVILAVATVTGFAAYVCRTAGLQPQLALTVAVVIALCAAARALQSLGPERHS